MRLLLRRLLFPIAIVVIAAAIMFFSRRGTDVQRSSVGAFVSSVLGGGPTGSTDRLIMTELQRRLQTVMQPGEAIEIEVRDGDGGPAPDGAASHVVMLRVKGLAAVGLRCRYDSDPTRMAIVGVFEPGS